MVPKPVSPRGKL